MEYFMKTRGFEKVSVNEFKKRAGKFSSVPERLYNDIIVPTRSTIGSAGYDFYSITKVTLKPGEVELIPTGIKAYMDFDEFLAIYIRSSLAVKNGIILANNVAIIDSDYYNNRSNEGHIMIALKNTSDKTYDIEKGDKIAQGIFQKFFITDDDNVLEKRKGGIGSTGK